MICCWNNLRELLAIVVVSICFDRAAPRCGGIMIDFYDDCDEYLEPEPHLATEAEVLEV